MLNKTLISGDGWSDACQQQLDTSDHIRGATNSSNRMEDQGDMISVITPLAKEKKKKKAQKQ